MELSQEQLHRLHDLQRRKNALEKANDSLSSGSLNPAVQNVRFENAKKLLDLERKIVAILED